MDTITNSSTVPHVLYSDPLIAKVVAMCVLGFASFIVGIIPVKIPRLATSVEGEKHGLMVSLLLCFGGGVLLFTTFIHLQPEVRAAFDNLNSKGKLPEIDFPLSELIFCAGFFFVYLVEELVHAVLHSEHKHQDEDALHRSLSVRCSGKKLSIPRVTLGEPPSKNPLNILAHFDTTSVSCISDKHLFTSSSTLSPSSPAPSSDGGHAHSHAPHLASPIGGLLTVLALSFHAVFEGLAVGLEAEATKVWYLFAAIATHKLVIGFCVGVELVTARTRTLLVAVYIGTFAVVTPLGIGIGLVLSESSSTHEEVVSCVLQGMAAGTLLYVVFFEVLARERGNLHSGLWQFVAILLGFAVMFTLQFLTGHEHSHGDSHEDHHHHHELEHLNHTHHFH